MKKLILLASAAILSSAFAEPAFAQAEAPIADASNEGVLIFTPDFFADQRPNTALDMVNRIPGFQVNNGSGDRGFEGNVGNVLINGARPASRNDTASNALQRVSASQVERIELIRGGAPGIDMQNFSVVANVITKNEASSESVLTFDSVFYDDGHPALGGSYLFTRRNGPRSWTFRLGRDPNTNDSNGEIDVLRVTPAGIVQRDETAISDSWGGNWSARGTYTGPLGGGTIDLTLRGALNDQTFYENQFAATIFRASRNAEDGWNGEFGATWTRPLGDRNQMEARLIHTMADWDGFNSFNELVNGASAPAQLFDFAGASQESILRAQLRHDRSAALSLEGGAELAYNMRDTDQALTVGGAVVPLPSASVKVEEVRGVGFGRVTWRPDPQWSVEGGLRLEVSEISQSQGVNAAQGFFYPKPRALVTWTPNDQNQLRLRLEREVSQLNFRDFSAGAQLANNILVGGNVDLEPSRRWIAEAVYERRFWGEGVVAITLRHDEIQDVIDNFLLPGGLTAVGNIGGGTLDRLGVSLTLPTDRLGIPGGRLSFNNNWDRTRVTDPTTGERRPISNTNVFQPRVNWEQDIPAWGVRWGAFWLPSYDRPRFNPDQYSTFRLSDYKEVFVEYKPTPTLTIMGRVTLWDEGLNERLVYANPTTRAVSFLETRDLDANTFYRLTVRKSF